MSTPQSSDVRAEVIRLRQSGHGPREIARLMGLSPGQVCGHLFRAGLTAKDHLQRRLGVDPALKAKMVRESFESWGAARRVAEKYGFAPETISRYRCEWRK